MAVAELCTMTVGWPISAAEKVAFPWTPEVSDTKFLTDQPDPYNLCTVAGPAHYGDLGRHKPRS